ncbi:hypothetical protein MSPP1_001763 [Malassezia sp. CBS 17886]|nr:hypothetical protein MSPP1_001763 [Malassezia sp. CBS 17886]
MYCLRWWLPVFLLPFPAAPPLLLFLFIVSYALQTRPWCVARPAADPSIYCSAILIGLFVTSCYWHTPSEPVAWRESVSSVLPWLPGGDSRVAFGMSRLLQWLAEGSSPTASLPPLQPAANTDGCASCWTDFALHPGRSFFDLIPRRPQGVAAPAAAGARHVFLGVPGTKLGFNMDFSVFY